MVKRFEVYLISLDPTEGKEIKKTRPCVVVSPDEFDYLQTYIIAPMTTRYKPFPTRVPVSFKQQKGFVALDQIRTIDKSRLITKLGSIDQKTGNQILSLLREIFEI